MGGNPLGLELTEGDRAACAAVSGIEKSARGCNAAPSEDGGRKSIHAISERSRSEPGIQYSDVQLSVTAPRLGRRVRDDVHVSASRYTGSGTSRSTMFKGLDVSTGAEIETALCILESSPYTLRAR